MTEDVRPGDDTRLRQVADVVRSLTMDYDLDEVVQDLVERSADMLAADSAGILLAGASGRLQVMATSSADAGARELYERSDADGPWSRSWDSGRPLQAADLSVGAAAWRGWADRAGEVGYGGLAALPITSRGRSVGTLGLLFRHGTLSPDGVVVAGLLADLASVVIVHERTRNHEHNLAQQLEAALASRVVIEQAKGVVAEQLGVDVDRAFALLRAEARRSGRRIAATAEDVVRRRLRLDG